MVSLVVALATLTVTTCAHALLPDGRLNANAPPMASIPKVMAINDHLPVLDRNGSAIPPYNTTYYFSQLIDHEDPEAGTFQMRYWATWEFWKPGGCVVLMTPGEGNAAGYTGYLTNMSINGQIAQQHNCAAIIVEHRFFGLSNPKPDLSTDSLRLLNIQQAIADHDYFARSVKLPFEGGDGLHPDSIPWVFIGGSYSGALVSWAMNSVDTFWAGYSSSGVVQAITDWWGYFTPIHENMPRNCSLDVERVIHHVDAVFTFGNKTEQQTLKEVFGMGTVKYLDDVAGALRNNLFDWQFEQPTSGPNSPFYQFCDALEVKNGVSAPGTGWGLNHTLQAWGNYWKTFYIGQICGDLDAAVCFDTHNSSQVQYTSTALGNSARAWQWLLCNELGFSQNGAPAGISTIVSRLTRPNLDLHVCSYMFPEVFKTGVAPQPKTLATNVKYKGWNTRQPRIFFGNGQRDPWRESTVSAEALRYPNTSDHTVGISVDGYHCSDMIGLEGTVSASVGKVQSLGLEAMARWLPQFKPRHIKH